MEKEIWKDVVDYEGLYKVSSFGRIWSVKTDRELNPSLSSGKRYFTVVLYKNKQRKSKLVHRLVAESFIENLYNKPYVNHKDGDKINNCLENLEWCTQLQNVQHAKSNGILTRGETAINSKLTEAAVVDIKEMIRNGFSNKEIAEIFSVHPGTINCIRTGRNWSHVK